MCGIIGYAGNRNAQEVLIHGLKELEYRGYDSSGIALKNNKKTQIIKSIGKISDLENKINNSKIIDSNLGIAHTRWATHGAVNAKNAHPHNVGKVTIVHNGIIENASVLRDKLINKGITFKSETDSEVIAGLINYYYKDDPYKAIEKAISELKGSYALGIIFSDINKLFAVRCESPLILGVGNHEYFIASDIGAILKYTKDYVLLGKNEIISIDNNGYSITLNGENVNRQVLKSNLNDESVSKKGYDHYMMKEIMEEPILIHNFIKKYINHLNKLPNIKKYKHFHIIGCGSAYYAGLIGKYLFEEDGIDALVEIASEYRYRNIKYDKNTLVIVISQSGETADTIAAMRMANENNVDTLAIVNVDGSTIARESKYKILIEAGREIAVATTKAFMLQVLVFSLLSYKINKDDTYLNDLKKLPSLLKILLDKTGYYKKIADQVYKHEDVFFIGRKIDYAISLEGSLKLKEISYIHSEAYQAGELKHGTISLINNGTVVFGILTDNSIYDKTLSNLEEVISRGANPIYISNVDADYENKIIIPKINKKLEPLLAVPPLQLIAYFVAVKRDCNIDKPKNLAKSVTVE